MIDIYCFVDEIKIYINRNSYMKYDKPKHQSSKSI